MFGPGIVTGLLLAASGTAWAQDNVGQVVLCNAFAGAPIVKGSGGTQVNFVATGIPDKVMDSICGRLNNHFGPLYTYMYLLDINCATSSAPSNTLTMGINVPPAGNETPNATAVAMDVLHEAEQVIGGSLSRNALNAPPGQECLIVDDGTFADANGDMATIFQRSINYDQRTMNPQVAVMANGQESSQLLNDSFSFEYGPLTSRIGNLGQTIGFADEKVGDGIYVTAMYDTGATDNEYPGLNLGPPEWQSIFRTFIENLRQSNPQASCLSIAYANDGVDLLALTFILIFCLRTESS